MNISKKIIRAINEGIIRALSFDKDELEPSEQFDLQVASNKDEIDNIKELTTKKYYTQKLEDFYDTIRDRLDFTKDISDQIDQFYDDFYNMAVEYYEKYGVKYNPHLDGRRFKDFIYAIIGDFGKERPKANLNWIDTSEVTDMQCLFCGDAQHFNFFNGDISEWDVSNVKSMTCMFDTCKFNGDLSKWDVSNVLYMNKMFAYSTFNNDSICNWDVSNVKTTFKMFYSDYMFNQDLTHWNLCNNGVDPLDMFNFEDIDYTSIDIKNLPKKSNH